MDLPAVVASHVHDLVHSIGAADDTLTRTLAALVEDLRSAVSSYQGLRLTLVVDGWPITLIAFADIDGVQPATSLRLALSGLGEGFSPESRIVFYAGSPGAFVDLAADLAYSHRMNGSTPGSPTADGNDATHRDGHRWVALDVDLPPVSDVSGLSGLTEFATINRAVGVLIDRGHSPTHAQANLRNAATVSGLTIAQFAALLVAE